MIRAAADAPAPALVPTNEPPIHQDSLPGPGPGRRRSRLNARTHGLTADVPACPAEVSRVKEIAEAWLDQLGAETDAEEALIRAAAAAFTRFERCRTAEDDTRHEAAREAVERWEKTRRHRARKTAQGLAADPHNTVLDLEESSFGCEWLMRQWRALDATLAQGLRWDHQDQALAMRLLGLRPLPPGPDGAPAVVRFWHLLCLASGSTVEPRPDHPDLPVAPIPARAALRRMIAEEHRRLEALRDEHRRGHDRHAAEAAARLGAVDTTKDGQLRDRYRKEAFSQMVRGLKEAVRLRVDRARLDDRRRPRDERPIGLPPGLDLGLDLNLDPGAIDDEPSADAPAPVGAVVSRNEPPGAAQDGPEDRCKSNPENSLGENAPDRAADSFWRTRPRPEASAWPIAGVPIARTAPIGVPIGPNPSPRPADRAG